MKLLKFILCALLALPLVVGCGGTEKKKKPGFSYEKSSSTKKTSSKKTTLPPSQTKDLVNKGIGPISQVTLNPKIDEAMVKRGAEIFRKNCTACHRPDKKFIGPAPKGIMDIRTPEWIMNMILNPGEMTKKDPLAKALLIEFNGSPMSNQGLSKEEARAVLEYFRTL